MSKSNKCATDSSSSNDKDFRHYPYPQNDNYNTSHSKADSPLSHICKYLDAPDTRKSSKENIELALEVEIDESLKQFLTKAGSDLLDVTIIRPSDSQTTHETTVALNKEEVRDFISLVEQHHRHQQSNEPISREKCKENRYRTDTSGERKQRKDVAKQSSYKEQKTEGKSKKDYGNMPDVHKKKVEDKNTKIQENPKQVYATINTFDKLRQALPCQNKDRDSDKPGTPCMCQHCGVVGVLVQSQKGPVAPFPPLEDSNETHQAHTSCRAREPTSARKDARHRRVMDMRKKRSSDQLDLLREINTRIKSLEKRIAVQEETAVPRDYLKHILHKILTQYNVRTSSSPDAKLKNNATQYSTKNIADAKVQQRSYGTSDKLRDIKNKNYQVHTVLEEHKNWVDYSRNNDRVLNDMMEKEKSSKDLYWFWGEEVVKPGCDLKTKILKLLDDKLTKKINNEAATTSTVPNAVITHQYFNRLENSTKNNIEGGIKIERDETTIFLDNVEHSVRNFEHLHQATQLSPKEESLCGKSTRAPALPTNENKFSNLRSIHPRTNYPFDVKKTLDDSTFRRNIEVQKEKNKERFSQTVEETYFNSYACQSMTTESKASMDYVVQKLKHNDAVLESGLRRDREAQIDARFKIPNDKDIPRSLIKENLNSNCFRMKKQGVPIPGSVDVKFINPRIKHWSEESTTSEERFMRHKTKPIPENKESVALEKKESLIYKLDFLKNLAKNRSTDQSRVLNKIWTQAKNTAKSKKDAVYIKIPFMNVSTCEAQNNLLEMHLTLEELETVVKAAKLSPSSVNVKVQSYKSSSEVDFGQRRHEEIKNANRELLRRRQLSAKTNKYRERR